MNLLDGESSTSYESSGTARGQETDIVVDKALGEIQKTCLVVDRKDSSLLGGSRRHGMKMCVEKGKRKELYCSPEEVFFLSSAANYERC